MPRHPYKKRTASPDPIYNSFEVSKLINYITFDGKKTVSRAIVYEMLGDIKKQKSASAHYPGTVIRIRFLGIMQGI